MAVTVTSRSTSQIARALTPHMGLHLCVKTTDALQEERKK